MVNFRVLAYVVISRHFFEIDHLKTILINNNYPLNFIDSCIKSFLDKLYIPIVMVLNVPKRNVLVKLSFLGSTLFQIQKKLQKLFSDKLMSFNSPSRIINLRRYFQHLFTSISMVAVMLSIIKRSNTILKSEFVNIKAFHISLE